MDNIGASLSVIVPALNEEDNLELAVETIRKIVPRYFRTWEVLIFNDGSTDATGRIADRLASSDPTIRVFHHEKPRNLGGCYKAGLTLASKEYVVLIPGDNECSTDVMRNVFALAGSADIIIPYPTNTNERDVGRRTLSKGFVLILNLLSGGNLRYYNGAVLHKTAIIKGCEIKTDGFGYQAEALIKLLRGKRSYVEVGTRINFRRQGSSKALRPQNLLQVARFLFETPRKGRLG